MYGYHLEWLLLERFAPGTVRRSTATAKSIIRMSDSKNIILNVIGIYVFFSCQVYTYHPAK